MIKISIHGEPGAQDRWRVAIDFSINGFAPTSGYFPTHTEALDFVRDWLAQEVEF